MRQICALLLLPCALLAYEIAPQGSINCAVGQIPGVDNSYEGISLKVPTHIGSYERLYALFDGTFSYLNKSNNFAVGNALTLEAGVRYITQYENAVYGCQTYFDYRRTYSYPFYQTGLSINRVSHVWDMRGNFFFPFGPRHHTREFARDTSYVGPYYLDYSEQIWAVRGVELAVARKVLINPSILLSPSATAYYLNSIENIWGFQIQCLLQYLNLWKVNFSITRDTQFKTRVQGYFEISFSSMRYLSYTFIRQALNNPIERFRFVLLDHFDWWRWNW